MSTVRWGESLALLRNKHRRLALCRRFRSGYDLHKAEVLIDMIDGGLLWEEKTVYSYLLIIDINITFRHRGIVFNIFQVFNECFLVNKSRYFCIKVTWNESVTGRRLSGWCHCFSHGFISMSCRKLTAHPLSASKVYCVCKVIPSRVIVVVVVLLQQLTSRKNPAERSESRRKLAQMRTIVAARVLLHAD